VDIDKIKDARETWWIALRNIDSMLAIMARNKVEYDRGTLERASRMLDSIIEYFESLETMTRVLDSPYRMSAQIIENGGVMWHALYVTLRMIRERVIPDEQEAQLKEIYDNLVRLGGIAEEIARAPIEAGRLVAERRLPEIRALARDVARELRLKRRDLQVKFGTLHSITGIALDALAIPGWLHILDKLEALVRQGYCGAARYVGLVLYDEVGKVAIAAATEIMVVVEKLIEGYQVCGAGERRQGETGG